MYIFMSYCFAYVFFMSFIFYKSQRIIKIFALLLMGFLTLMIGFRYDVGVDYKEYEYWFNFWFDNLSFKEPIWGIIIYLVRSLGGEFYLVTLLIALLTNMFIYLGLKVRNVTGIYLILAIFIYSTSFLFVSANIMRQGVAIAIFFYCSFFITKKEFWKYTFFMFLASGFHISILLLYPLYFIKVKSFMIRTYFIAIIVSYILILSPIIPSLLSLVTKIPYFSKYTNNEFIFNGDVKIFSLGVILKVVISILLLLVVSNQKDVKFNLELNYYLIGVLLNIMSLYSFLIARVGIYFQVFEILMIPVLIRAIPNRKLRLFISFLIIIFMSLLLFKIIISPESLNLEYKSIFNKE